MRLNPLAARCALALLPALPTLAALAATVLLFAAFLAAAHAPALDALGLIAQGAFGSSFAWQNTLLRAAPLMLTALCVALPAQVGLIVIGGEGALALGGLASAAVPLLLPAGTPPWLGLAAMAVAAMLAGGLWIGAAGALRQWRGVNETISSLLLSYIAIAVFKFLVEGPLRDPASLNKPSTRPIPDAFAIGSLPGLDVHWGLLWGALACLAAWVLVRHATQGFAMRIVGGNPRAARLAGLPVARLTLLACTLGGAANASLLVGYGYGGILVAFAARHNPLAIVLCAIGIGGMEASGSLLQRRLDLPDATTLVLQGLLFANLLAFEALGPRLAAWRLKLQDAARAARPLDTDTALATMENTHA